jgi:phage gp46-like protein
MPDIRLIQDTADFTLTPDGKLGAPHYTISIDWSLMADGTLDTDQALATAVIVALGTDALANRDDLLPDPDSTDRAGWWGDLDAEEIWSGWPIGCKLWLLRRSKIEGPGSRYGATVKRVENYIRDAIQPFIDQRIASRFEVGVERTGTERIEALVKIFRSARLAVELRYEVLWDDILEA